MTILVSPFHKTDRGRKSERERRQEDDDLKWRNGDRKAVGIISRSAGCQQPCNHPTRQQVLPRSCRSCLHLSTMTNIIITPKVLWFALVHDVAQPNISGSKGLAKLEGNNFAPPSLRELIV